MAIQSWVQQHDRRVAELGLSLVEENNSVRVEVGDATIMVMMPSCFIILVDGAGERMLVDRAGERMQDMIMDLNDRMQQDQQDQPDDQFEQLFKVLDSLLLILAAYRHKKIKLATVCKDDPDVIISVDKTNQDIDGDDDHDVFPISDDDDEEENELEEEEEIDFYGDYHEERPETTFYSKEEGSLYSFAVDAAMKCANSKAVTEELSEQLCVPEKCANSKAKAVAEEISEQLCVPEAYLGHCRVTHAATFVKLEIMLGTLLQQSKYCRILDPLGLDSVAPLTILLDFGTRQWNASSFSKADFSTAHLQVLRFSQNLKEKCPKNYGTQVLVPLLVDLFIKFYTSGKVASNKIIIDAKWLAKNNGTMLNALQLANIIENPFLGLLYFVASQLWMLPSWCPLCCRLLPKRPMKLLSCVADKCLFEFQEQGLASSVLAQVKHFPIVVELEISLLIAAANSQRDVLEPFPSFLLNERENRKHNGWFGDQSYIPPGGEANSTVRNGQNKMILVIKNVLQTIASVQDLAQCNSEPALEKLLTDSLSKKIKTFQIETGSVDHPQRLAYKLLSYCLSSNRTSLKLLEENDRLNIEGTLAQFAVLYDTPEKEGIAGQKSFFAFHGSQGGNWYSILRNGIRSMSRSRYMSVGATHGQGIYCSHMFNVSLQYCRSAMYGIPNNEDSVRFFKDGICCMAIVEVFHELPLVNNFCYVVPKEFESRVVLRYLLVLPNSNTNSLVLPNSNTGSSGATIEGSVLVNQSMSVNLAHHHHRLRDPRCD